MTTDATDIKKVCEESIRTAFEHFSANKSVVGIRALGNGPIYEAYCTNADDAVRIAQQVSDMHEYQCYAVLNTIKDEFLQGKPRNTLIQLKRGEGITDKDISIRNFILIDFDPQRPPHTSSTDEEKTGAKHIANEVYKDLLGYGFPKPLCADSGNGYHILYRIDWANDEYSTTLIRRFLQALNSQYPEIDKAVYNPSRICKFYGTEARKGENTPERPHRMSSISPKLKNGVFEILEIKTVEDFLRASEKSANPQIELPTEAKIGTNKPTYQEVEALVEQLESSMQGQLIKADRDAWVKCSMAIGLLGVDGKDLFNRFNRLWERADIVKDYDKFISDFSHSDENRIGINYLRKFVEQFGKSNQHEIDTNLLPTWFNMVVDKIAWCFFVPRSFAVICVLQALSSVILKKSCAYMGSYLNYGQVWSILLGNPSVNKSKPLRWAFEPILIYDKTLQQQNRLELQEWRKNDKTGDRPPERCIISKDVSPEKRQSLLVDNADGFTTYVDEFSGVFNSFDRYHQGSELQDLIDGYNNGYIKSQRKGEDTKSADKICLLMTGTTQPHVLADCIRKNHALLESGFLHRFLWVYEPDFVRPEYEVREMPKDIEDNWRYKIRELIDMPDQGKSHFSEEAQQLYANYVNGHIRKINNGIHGKNPISPLEQQIMGKGEIQCVRLAVLANALKYFNSPIAEKRRIPEVIDADCMKFAVDAMDYFEWTAKQALSMGKDKLTSKNLIQTIFQMYPDANQSGLAKVLGVSQQYVNKYAKTKTTE